MSNLHIHINADETLVLYTLVCYKKCTNVPTSHLMLIHINVDGKLVLCYYQSNQNGLKLHHKVL